MLALIRSQLGFYKRIYRNLEGRKLLKHHLKNVGFHTPPKLRIVFCCNGVVVHGGLVDRLKGAISMYNVALELGAEFYISFTDPFELSDYLAPNEVAWNKGDVKFNPLRDRIIYAIKRNKPGLINPVTWFDAKTPRTYFVYSNLNYLEGAYPTWSQQQLRDLWQQYFYQLFTYSKVLLAGLNELPKERRVVCHTRFLGVLGDFNETTDNRLTSEEVIALFGLLDERLQQLVDLHPGIPLYLLSDSPRFLAHVAEQGICKILPGTPKHVDVKNEENNAADHLKTFTDFVFMAESDAIYSLVLPPMHSSMFCAMAAMLGKKKVNRIFI